MISSRREVFQLAGASLASAAALSITERVPAQVPEEANSPSVTIVHKGINKELDIVNIDLLEASAKQVLPEGIFVSSPTELVSSGPCARTAPTSRRRSPSSRTP